MYMNKKISHLHRYDASKEYTCRHKYVSVVFNVVSAEHFIHKHNLFKKITIDY